MKSYLSQAGQDKWVDQCVFRGKKRGYFLDIGAFDGREISNTYFLEKYRNWDGICIEGDSKNFARLVRNRRCQCVKAIIGAPPTGSIFVSEGAYSRVAVRPAGAEPDQDKQEKESAPTLRSILDRCAAPKLIDYITVDVEGMEDSVMSEVFDSGRHCLAFTIERPSDWLRRELADRNYLLCVDQPGLDAFFLHNSLAEKYLSNLIDSCRYESKRGISFLADRLRANASYIWRYGLRGYLDKRRVSAFIDLCA